MSKYLDFDGVKYLWSKIKKIIDPLDERITDIEQAVIDNMTPPQNLLINGDFQIWQRGESFTIEGDEAFHYTADMWCVYASTGQAIEVNRITDGLQFSGATAIMQRMNPLEVGKNYTFVCRVNDDVKTLPIVGGTYTENNFLRYDKSGSYEQFQIKSNGITNIASARLWEGNTIYKLIQEDDATALMRCMKKIQSLVDFTIGGRLILFLLNGSNVLQGIPFFMPMDSVPTVESIEIMYSNGQSAKGITATSSKNEITRIDINDSDLFENSYAYLNKLIVTCEPL